MKKAKTPWDFGTQKKQSGAWDLSALADSLKTTSKDDSPHGEQQGLFSGLNPFAGLFGKGKNSSTSGGKPPVFDNKDADKNRTSDGNTTQGGSLVYSRTVYGDIMARHNSIINKIRSKHPVSDSDIKKGIIKSMKKQNPPPAVNDKPIDALSAPKKSFVKNKHNKTKPFDFCGLPVHPQPPHGEVYSCRVHQSKPPESPAAETSKNPIHNTAYSGAMQTESPEPDSQNTPTDSLFLDRKSQEIYPLAPDYNICDQHR